MIGVLNLPVLAPQRLRNEALAVRRAHVELLFKDPMDGSDYDVYERIGAAVRRVADAETAAGSPAAAVKWAERWRKTLQPVLLFEEKRFNFLNGNSPMYQVWNVVLEADLDLNRRREVAKVGPLLTAAEKFRLCTSRVEVLAWLEKLASKNFRHGNGTEAESLTRKIALLEAEADLAQLKESSGKVAK